MCKQQLQNKNSLNQSEIEYIYLILKLVLLKKSCKEKNFEIIYLKSNMK